MAQKVIELDAKILQTLLKDGRIGYDELAAECGATKNLVWKHCKRMEEKGIIKGATVQINFAHLGFDALATLLVSVNAQQIEQIMEFIQKITEIRAYRQYNSVYNIRGVATLRDLNELDQVKQLIKRKLPTIGLKSYIWTGVRNIPENLNFTAANNAPSVAQQVQKDPICSPPERITVDPVDMQIIQRLALNGRIPFTEIAKQLDLSTNTIVKRYSKLRRNGTMKVSIQLDLARLGYTAILDCNIAFTSVQAMAKSMVDSLAQIPDLIIITKTSGDYDLQLTAMVRDIKQAFNIQDEIARIPGVTQIEASTRKIPEKWPTPQQYISVL